MQYKCSIQPSVVDQPCTHCISFRCRQCGTNARSSFLWWANLAPTAFHFGVTNVIQRLDPALCGGPTLHPLHFISVCPMWHKCSIQLSVVDQPCTHCITIRCSQNDTNARSSFLWWPNLAPNVFHFGVANVIQMLDPALCAGPTLHPLHFISV